MSIFTQIFAIDSPVALTCDANGVSPAFEVHFQSDGAIPFPQIVVHGSGPTRLIRDAAIRFAGESSGVWSYIASIPSGFLGSGRSTLQVEGCRTTDLQAAKGEDWVKSFFTLDVLAGLKAKPESRLSSLGGAMVKVYFGIHKHMHQPYYNTTDRDYWDGEKDGIFGSRVGNYSDFVPAAVRQYADSGLPHAGLSTSWSGSLVEQLDRCAETGRCGGHLAGWNHALREMAQAKTRLGNPRLSFSAFGFFHPLMPLIPDRDIARQIEWHRGVIRSAFGVEASRVLFPPETAFHVRMIPALRQAGISAVVYDSIHRYRACRDYPYAGPNEGMLPPNPSEQTNAAVDDWLQLHNVWAGSKIAPSLLRPEYVGYEDPDGQIHTLIAVPAERYIGNEDARGGFGALQYPDVLGQLYHSIAENGTYDPKHPPFFLLHSDGDNHGGGADSYYKHNTAQLLNWLRDDPRFELITTEDYLTLFPPDPTRIVHIEPGSWSGADNGDPQFMKWFSRYDQAYSPDLNSWAVLTAFQNLAHTLEDSAPDHPDLPALIRLLLTAETSCYWYWTGQHIWDQQVTAAANQAYPRLQQALAGIRETERDVTGPTIFPPWVTPENPGGKRWGSHGLADAPREAQIHSFVYDVSGLVRVELVIRSEGGETRASMQNHGPYRSETGAMVSANYLTATLPVGAGDIRYYIEAEDRRGNVMRSALERLYLA